MGIQYCDKLCYVILMSDKRTYKSHKEHGEDMTYESEVKHKMDDRGNLDLTKQIDKLKAEKVALYKQVKDLRNLEDGHQKLNGELRLQLVQEIEKVKKEADRLMMKKITKYEKKIRELKQYAKDMYNYP